MTEPFARGGERIAARWADHRKMPEVAVKADWTKHIKAAPFKRSDQMLAVSPIGFLNFPGTGSQDNLADKARKLGMASHGRHLSPLMYDGDLVYCYHCHHTLIYAIMPAVTIRNLSNETHRALKTQAAQHNRSTEAEMRAILDAAVRPEGRLRLGTALAEMSRKIGLSNADVDALEQTHNAKPAKPLRL